MSQTQKINTFSKKSQELIADLNNTEIFELCENSSKQQCPDCNVYWETVKSIAAVEEMWSLRGVRQSSTRTTVTAPQSLDYVIKKNSKRGAKHGPSVRQKTYHQARQMLYKDRQGKHGCHPKILSTMARRRRIQKVVVGHRVERTPHNVVLQNRLGEAHLHRNKSWENSKFESLDSHDKCRRVNSAITQSTTRLCSSEKRMQTIAWRAPGKDPRRIQSHSSQSTNKTAKMTPIWGQRRILLRGWHQNRLEVLQRVTEKLAHKFVRIAGQLANSFVIVVNVEPNPLEDEQLEFFAFFKPWRLVTFFSQS